MLINGIVYNKFISLQYKPHAHVEVSTTPTHVQSSVRISPGQKMSLLVFP